MSSNALFVLKQQLKAKGHAAAASSVAQALLDVLRATPDDVLKANNLTLPQFAALLLRAGTRLGGADTAAAYRELSGSGTTLDLVAAAERDVVPETAPLRTPEEILAELKQSLTSRQAATDLTRRFAKRARAGTKLIGRPQVAAALASFGMQFSAPALSQLFSVLDTTGSGSINYEELLVKVLDVPVSWVSKVPPLQRPQTASPTRSDFYRGPNTLSTTQAVDVLRDRLIKAAHLQSGARNPGMLGVFRALLAFAGSADQTVSLPQLRQVFKDCNINIRGEDVDALFASWDRDASGHLDLSDFVAGMFPHEANSPKPAIDHNVLRGQRLTGDMERYAQAQSVERDVESLQTAIRSKLKLAKGSVQSSFMHFLAKVGGLLVGG
jgi:Ca2+-binding EF-hand superfamily protein